MLQSILFESPISLGIVSFVLFAVVLLARRRLESDRIRAWALPAVLLLTVAIFILQALVTTDREAINSRMDALANAVAAKDLNVIAELFDANYRADDMDYKELVAYMEDILKKVDVYDARFLRRDLQIDGDSARFSLRAMATVKIVGGAGETHMGDWEIHWARRGGVWSITQLRPTMIDQIPINSLGTLRGYVP